MSKVKSHINFSNVFQKEIPYFLVLSEDLNISKAAEKLGIQQSGLSRALQRLESELNEKLFIRKNNGLKLSPAGEKFLEAVTLTQNTWNHSLEKIRSASDSTPVSIRLGLNPSFGKKYLGKMIQELTQTYKSAELEVSTGASFKLVRDIQSGTLDFALVASSLRQPEIVSKPISMDYLATYKTETLKESTHLIFNPETQMSLFHLKKFTNFTKIKLSEYDLIAKAASETGHLALLPHSVASSYPELHAVSGKIHKAQISLIAHKEKLRSKIYTEIFHNLYQIVKEL